MRNKGSMVGIGILGAILIGFVSSRAQGDEPALVRVAPGTVVGGVSPQGWSHLIVKSVPRLASGDLGTLPSSSARTTSLFRTVILANVKREPNTGRYTLQKVGIGLCIPHAGRDECVEPDSISPAAKSLGTIDRIVLGEAFGELKRGTLVARSPRMAIYRAPTTMLMGKAHHKVLLCYVLSVDPTTGSLTTWVWWSLDEAPTTLVATSLVELAPSLQLDCGLDVKASRILGSIPVSWSFGMAALPPGKSVAIETSLTNLLTRSIQSAKPSEKLEQALVALTAGRTRK